MPRKPPTEPPSNVTPLRPSRRKPTTRPASSPKAPPRKTPPAPPRPSPRRAPPPVAPPPDTAPTTPRRKPGQKPSAAEAARLKDLFIARFEQSGNVRQSAYAVDVERRTIYDWLEKDAAFAERFRQAEIEFEDVVEGEALRRAVHGVQEPLVSMGKAVYDDVTGEPLMVTKYSDTLLIKMLAARHRKYAPQQKLELSGPGGQQLRVASEHTVTLDVRSLSSAQLAILAGLLEAPGNVVDSEPAS